MYHVKLPIPFRDTDDIKCMFLGNPLTDKGSESMFFSRVLPGKFPDRVSLDITNMGGFDKAAGEGGILNKKWDAFIKSKFGDDLTADMILEFLNQYDVKPLRLHDDFLLLDYMLPYRHGFSLINLRHNETTS